MSDFPIYVLRAESVAGGFAPSGSGTFLELMTRLRNEGVMVVFDPNIRKRLWENDNSIRRWIGRGYAACNVALPSWSDEADVFGDLDLAATTHRIRNEGVEEIVVKNGSGVCLVQAAREMQSIAPQASLPVVDTTGAGDSFNAGYLASRLMGALPAVAVQKAHSVAAKVIVAHGALVPLGGELLPFRLTPS